MGDGETIGDGATVGVGVAVSVGVAVGVERGGTLEDGATEPALEAGGVSIGPMDLLIAAQARSLGATLVTANTKEFQRVKGLKIRAWK